MLAVLVGCSDPPTPPPTAAPDGLPRWSSSTHVAWTGATAPEDPGRLLAVVVDARGGPQDRLAGDPDVTTFLNDRFHPLFLDAAAVDGIRPIPALLFVDHDGCLVGGVQQPTDPAAWIARANEVLLSMSSGNAARTPLPGVAWPRALAADHPLRAGCRSGGATRPAP